MEKKISDFKYCREELNTESNFCKESDVRVYIFCTCYNTTVFKNKTFKEKKNPDKFSGVNNGFLR
jgi:hypothetical protein